MGRVVLRIYGPILKTQSLNPCSSSSSFRLQLSSVVSRFPVMANEKVKAPITSFTPKGKCFAALLPSGDVKVWNTSDGSVLTEWKHSEGDSDVQVSSIACSFVGKKWKKEQGTCLVALGTDGGEVLAIDVPTGEVKWKSAANHSGRIAALSFSNKGSKLSAIGANGVACVMDSVTGELLNETKVPKKYISSTVHLYDDKILAAARSRIRVLSLEDGKELLKFSTDKASVQHISILDNTKAVVTTCFGDKNLQVWNNESSSGSVSSGPLLSMTHPPLAVECMNGCNGEDDLAVLSVSESGVAYIWILKASSGSNTVPTRIKVKADKSEGKKSSASIFAARLHSFDSDGQVKALIAFGSIDSPQFSLVDINSPGEDIGIDVRDEAPEDGVNYGKDDSHINREEVRSKKRPAADPDTQSAGSNLDDDLGHEDPMDGVQINDDPDEPTMGEKLASLNLINNDDGKDPEKPDASPRQKPPSADSVHVLLKQALHADDRSLLLDCLFRQDEKVIANSVSLLNPSDVFKLLESLVFLIQSRGTVLVCALPWLKSLLLQHASIIMCQESSLLALNSLFQLIESRISTFNPALQLSSCLDLLYTKTVDDGVDEEDGSVVEPIIYEDQSDEEGSAEDAMETDGEDDDEYSPLSNVSDVEGASDDMGDL